ncbi:MAG: hypothetical protein HC888_15250 [Candidatus Competibacteraceae bacterium]|nr:hypothetical protein [Candidatus Competibacteraceae bacterium]
MAKINLPHDAFVFVGDGRKALFLRNEGDEKFLNLKTERVLVDQNPPTREQGTDQPGRSFASVGSRRSAVEEADWHVLEEQRFAHEVAAALQAEKLVFLTDTPGVLADKTRPESLIHQLRAAEVTPLRRDGVIAGGMIPKIDACLKALDYGVRKTHIIDGRVKHALLLEIFTTEGMGTLVTH